MVAVWVARGNTGCDGATYLAQIPQVKEKTAKRMQLHSLDDTVFRFHLMFSLFVFFFFYIFLFPVILSDLA